jgi:hypothetical protein
MDSTDIKMLAVRITAILFAVVGAGTTVIIGNQTFTQAEIGTTLAVVLTGVSAVYGMARTFYRGKLKPTSSDAIEPHELISGKVPPRVRAILNRMEARREGPAYADQGISRPLTR